jgi:regulator of RNase E activity RraA
MTSPTQNHQVVATGYDLDEYNRRVTLFLYDPNHPGKEPELTVGLDPDGDPHIEQSTGEPLRGFFVLDYGPRKRGLPLDLDAALEPAPPEPSPSEAPAAPAMPGARSLAAGLEMGEDTGPQTGSASTDEERRALLELYDGLRVTDVSDGMDLVGLWDRGNMYPQIKPLWRDTEGFAHRVYGFAHTVRFVPTNRPVTPRTPEETRAFIRHWYREWAPGPHRDTIREGDFIVIDGQDLDVGYIGSNNALSWIAAGAVGAVTNGGCRDTDELIKQRVPVYSRMICKTIRPGRLEFLDEQVPVTVGGVMVRPGDLVVADGDGVVVVPIEVAREVGEYAWEVAKGDKAGRRALYERVGLPLDDTV